MRRLLTVLFEVVAGLFRAVFAALAVLALATTPARAEDIWQYEYVWYEPEALGSVDQAAGTIINLQKFFTLYGGMNIDQIVVTREGLAIHGSQTTIQQESHYQPTYGGSWIGDTYVPYYGGTTVTTPVSVTSQNQVYIPFKDVQEVILLHYPLLRNGWAVHFIITGQSRSVTLRTSDEGLARQFANAAVTFIERSNPNFYEGFDEFGMRGDWNDAKAFKKAKYKGSGFHVTNVMRGSPAERAGVLPGDIWISLNGMPRTGKEAISDLIGPAYTFNRSFSFDFEVWRKKASVPLHITVKNIRLIHAIALNPIALGLGFRETIATDPLLPGQTVPSGISVVGVYEGTLANRMDIRAGDILFELNGMQVKSGNDFKAALKQGPVTAVKVLREGAVVELRAPAPPAPPPPPPPAPVATAPQRLGLGVRDVPAAGTAPAYVEVASVEAGQGAAKMDFRVGDKLVEANGKPVHSTADLAAIIAAGPIETAKVERAGATVNLGKVTVFKR